MRRERLSRSAAGELPLLDELRERRAELVDRLLRELRRGVREDDLDPCLRRNLRDPRAHLPGPDDRHPLDRHARLRPARPRVAGGGVGGTSVRRTGPALPAATPVRTGRVYPTPSLASSAFGRAGAGARSAQPGRPRRRAPRPAGRPARRSGAPRRDTRAPSSAEGAPLPLRRCRRESPPSACTVGTSHGARAGRLHPRREGRERLELLRARRDPGRARFASSASSGGTRATSTQRARSALRPIPYWQWTSTRSPASSPSETNATPSASLRCEMARVSSVGRWSSRMPWTRRTCLVVAGLDPDVHHPGDAVLRPRAGRPAPSGRTRPRRAGARRSGDRSPGNDGSPPPAAARPSRRRDQRPSGEDDRLLAGDLERPLARERARGPLEPPREDVAPLAQPDGVADLRAPPQPEPGVPDERSRRAELHLERGRVRGARDVVDEDESCGRASKRSHPTPTAPTSATRRTARLTARPSSPAARPCAFTVAPSPRRFGGPSFTGRRRISAWISIELSESAFQNSRRTDSDSRKRRISSPNSAEQLVLRRRAPAAR